MVLDPPVIGSFLLVDNVLTISWATIPGQAYDVQATDDLSIPSWQTVTNFTATESSAIISLQAGSADKKFYRLMVQP